MTDVALRDGPILRAGIIPGPDGQAYRLRRDLSRGDALHEHDFEPMGGAPDPKIGEMMPVWLWAFLQNVAALRIPA